MPIRAPRCFWIGRDRDHRLGRCLEQDIVDDRLVLIRDVRDRAWQRVDDVEVWRRGATRLPAPPSHSLAAAPWHFGQCRLRQLLYALSVCAQPSQRATCPPSATVRQRSIALMTFIWSRLTWPALARRHAVPWSRKISATSRAGRDMAGRSSRLRRLASLPGRPARLAQQVEWALDGRDHAGGHARVARCRVELVVTEESLNDADIGPTFEQMGRKTVAQRMQRHRLLDAGRVSRLVKQTIELPGRHPLS